MSRAQLEHYSGSTFRCVNGRGDTMSASVVNDNYCDCADGSDEPGTPACGRGRCVAVMCWMRGNDDFCVCDAYCHVFFACN